MTRIAVRPFRVALLLGLGLLAQALTLSAAVEARDVLGAAHVAGKYNFTGDDYLNEGADRLLDLGTRVIKVWFRLDPEAYYPFNSDWSPAPANLVELAQKPYYQELFAKPFTTYFLVIAPVTVTSQFLDGMTPEETAAEREHMRSLAAYLLTTYAWSGKTFVLQNWEGDHLMRQGLPAGVEPYPNRIQGMRDWWTARQEGVEQARREVAAQGVTVAHAAEVNLITEAMAGKITATNDVLPFIHPDLVSYSSWDVRFDRAQLVQALDYLEEKTPDSALFGDRNVYLGEFGGVRDQMAVGADIPTVIQGLAEAALGWGVRWAVYWQVYCNSTVRDLHGRRPAVRDMRGFWLVRPDNRKTRMWETFQKRLSGTLTRVALASDSGDGRLVAVGDGGAVRVNLDRPRPWTTFTITDLNGGALRSGERVTLQSHSGFYLSTDGTGKVTAKSAEAGPAETFVLWKIGGTGTIQGSDDIALQAGSGRYVIVEGSGQLRAAGTATDPLAKFRFRSRE
ncbi:MAG TPA: hypothetical protein VMW27_29325 [Thermoanaerobaculia bacterium]|nr:hypothetical protein [Thermoanaerobaculia bacterium]